MLTSDERRRGVCQFAAQPRSVMTSVRRAAPVAILVNIFMFGGCGSPSSPSPPPGGGNGTTVTIASSGVTPAQLEVALGARVLFVNNDSRSHDIEWDPHPEHNGCPPPAVGALVNPPGLLAPGQSRETGNLVFAMTCGYHDHDDAQNTRWQGRIVVR